MNYFKQNINIERDLDVESNMFIKEEKSDVNKSEFSWRKVSSEQQTDVDVMNKRRQSESLVKTEGLGLKLDVTEKGIAVEELIQTPFFMQTFALKQLTQENICHDHRCKGGPYGEEKGGR